MGVLHPWLLLCHGIFCLASTAETGGALAPAGMGKGYLPPENVVKCFVQLQLNTQ